MTCREVAAFLGDYVSGVLTAEVRAGFDRHLTVCPNCRAYLGTYRATIEMGLLAFSTPDADAQAEVPPELIAAILAAVRPR